MLETILIILVVLWALGLFAFHAGGLIHVLLVIAAIVLSYDWCRAGEFFDREIVKRISSRDWSASRISGPLRSPSSARSFGFLTQVFK